MEGVFSALYSEAYLGLIRQMDSVPRTGEPRRDLIQTGLDGFRRWALAHPNLSALPSSESLPTFGPGPRTTRSSDLGDARHAVAVR